MKKSLKLAIFPVITLVLVALLLVFSLMGNTTESLIAEEAKGSDGVIYADYFTGNSARYEWQFGESSQFTKDPAFVNNAMLTDGFSGMPGYAILQNTLPSKCDIYFTAQLARIGESTNRFPAVFLNVGEKFGTRYMLWIQDGSVMLSQNTENAIIQKKVEGLDVTTVHSYRMALDGASLALYIDGNEKPVFDYTASADFATLADARNLAVYGRASEFYFDDLVITDGEHLIPVEKLTVTGQGGTTIEGIGTKLQMQAFISPYNCTDKGLVWSVDDQKVAKITTDGLLTAKGYGTVTVTARTRDGSGVAASCKITVKQVPGADAGTEIISPYEPDYLADAYVSVFTSDDPHHLQPMSPYVTTLKSGRIIAAFDLVGDRVSDRTPIGYEENPGWVGYRAMAAYSDDGGKTWTYSLERLGLFPRAFEDGNKVYYIYRNDAAKLTVAVSEDNGETWSEGSVIDERSWHSAPTSVITKGDNLYMTMEVSVNGSLAPILIRGKCGTDLTKKENWSFSEPLSLMEIIKDAKRSDLDYTGIQRNNNTDTARWLEGNVFQIYDENHPWYDPSMNTFYIYSRQQSGRAGYAGLIKVTENADGTMTPSVVKSAAGKDQVYVAMPGGNDKFSMIYDETSKLYWLASNFNDHSIIEQTYTTGDMQADPALQRDRLALWFSRDALNWEFAGMVTEGDSRRESRAYPHICVDGDDLLVVTRCGTEESRSLHDNDILSFHRVKDFRDLAY